MGNNILLFYLYECDAYRNMHHKYVHHKYSIVVGENIGLFWNAKRYQIVKQYIFVIVA